MSPTVDTERIVEEIRQTKIDLKNYIDASEARLLLKLEKSHERVKQLGAENSILRSRVEELERRQREANIVVYGLNEEGHKRVEQGVLRRHLAIHRENGRSKSSFIRGNRLVVDSVEYTAEQLLDIEKSEEKSVKANSAPSTPVLPLFRELPVVLPPLVTAATTTPIEESTRNTGAIRKRQKFVGCQNTVRTKTRSNREKVDREGSFVIVWKKGATLLSAGQQMITREPRFSLLGYNLQVRDIRHSDQGDYTCQIGDGSQGDLIHTIEILMPPSIHILPPNGQVTVRRGGPVSFECRASGNPEPIVQWTKKDGILPSGLQVQSGYLLSLGDVQRQDAGMYLCTASNGIGEPVSGEIRLNVLYPPEVSVLRSWVNSGEGMEAKLDCVVHSDPPSEVTWYQDSFLLQPTDRRLMTLNGQTHTLTIRNVQMSDFGNYSCNVFNSIGRDKRYIELSGKPGPARITSPSYSNPHEYLLTWTVQSVFPIIDVRILYRRVMVNTTYQYPGQWHDLLVKPPQRYNSATGERIQSFKLAGLIPDSVYECLVQTKNQHGFGELSDLHQWFSSQRGRPLVYNSAEKINRTNCLVITILMLSWLCHFKNYLLCDIY